MAKKKTPAAPTTEPVEPVQPVDDGTHADGPDFSLVLPLSLLAGGVAAYPSLSAVAEGEGDFMGAVVLFLGATLLATIGFAIVAVLFHSYSSAAQTGDEDGDGDELTDQSVRSAERDGDGDGPVPTVALNPPPDPLADAIDTALAPTDALVHDAT
jgi:hypothetical protein